MKTLKSVLFVVFTLSIFLGVYFTVDRHECNWNDCDHQGRIINQWLFSSEWGAEEYSDTWCIEFTHFMNPEMTYEECEEYVFSGIE